LPSLFCLPFFGLWLAVSKAKGERRTYASVKKVCKGVFAAR